MRVLFIALLSLLASIAAGCGGAPTAKMEQGVEFEGLTLPREVAPGTSILLDFSFKTTRPLDGDWWVFIHFESAGPQNCRVVFDRAPSEPIAGWHGQVIHHKVEVPISGTCTAGRLEVFAGLYNRTTFARLKIVDPPTMDNRLAAGWIEVVCKH